MSQLEFYDGTDVLDVDVYQVGHHGSHNGTTVDLLEAMTPQIAVISVGEWDFGSPNQPFSTHAYGHPRRSIVDMPRGIVPTCCCHERCEAGGADTD